MLCGGCSEPVYICRINMSFEYLCIVVLKETEGLYVCIL